ncbi:MAG: histidine kinase [Prolixibacteraceae bacterium]|jgi:signal transduction histidine kinase|nr:histidine kinase [Prolixibacteraceae bacterium]
MAIKIALILSVILQFGAAIIALSLVKRTRTNIAWWLISLAFLLMAFRRVFELFEIYNLDYKFTSQMLSSWTGVAISVIMLLSLAFVRRIFNLQKQLDQLRKQNEARVLSAIIKTEEKERQHFAKELHDGLGPLLSSVKMAISAKRNSDKTNDKVIINAEKLIEESVITLKEISNNLSPHVLNNFGLHKAIKSFIGKLNIIDNPKIKFASNIKGERFAYNIEVVLYRIVCELISNSLQHANANNIYIDILKTDHKISLEYIDDGDGFDLKENNFAKNGQGFSNIKSRIKSLNGQYNFFTSPDEGVQVKISINIS